MAASFAIGAVAPAAGGGQVKSIARKAIARRLSLRMFQPT
jgi:hypothetical protein